MAKNINLPSSPVVFEPEHHTYTLNGKMLSGVTAIVKWLFPDTYAGIPESILMQAAEYGTLIHGKCELADSMGIVDDPIVKDYKRIIKDEGLEVACSEYLVSDEKNIASSIDIWLPKPQYGTPMVKELTRIPSEVCKYVVELYVEHFDPIKAVDPLTAVAAISKYLPANPVHNRVQGEIPDAMSQTIEELMMVKQQLDELGEREKELKKQLLAAMQGVNEDTWSNDLIQITRKASYERETIDTKALKANEPSIYESYKKVTKVAESLTYKLL